MDEKIQQRKTNYHILNQLVEGAVKRLIKDSREDEAHELLARAKHAPREQVLAIIQEYVTFV